MSKKKCTYEDGAFEFLSQKVLNYDESWHTVHVISVNTSGNDVQIRVYDYDEGEYRTFEMDMDTDDQLKKGEPA